MRYNSQMPTGHSISVRLDREAAAALRTLEQAGMSRSEAVRHALMAAVQAREQRGALAREVAALAADEQDRSEKAAIAAALDEISEPW